MQGKIFNMQNFAGINVNNLIFRSATEEGLANIDGTPSQNLINRYIALAKGEVGAIITGYIGVSKQGESNIKGMCVLDNDDKIASFKEMVDKIHQLNTPIIAQIAHCGRNGKMGKKGNVNKLSKEEIEKIIEDFISCAIRCEKAGFDGIELHCAHIYLLAEFLSPTTNKRKDEYGGNSIKRFNIVRKIIQGIKKKCPTLKIFIKMNGSEVEHYKKSIKEACKIAKLFENEKVQALEISCGISIKQLGSSKGKIPAEMILKGKRGVNNLPKIIKLILKPFIPIIIGKPKSDRLYNLQAATAIKNNVNLPIILVGGISSIEDIKIALNNKMDAISMSRPFIIEPNIVQKFKKGISICSKCIKCNYCLIGIEEAPLRCYYGKLPK